MVDIMSDVQYEAPTLYVRMDIDERVQADGGIYAKFDERTIWLNGKEHHLDKTLDIPVEDMTELISAIENINSICEENGIPHFCINGVEWKE